MAKPNPYAKKMSEIFGVKVVDENAFTIREMAGPNSCSHTAQRVRAKLASGEVEQVWKKVGIRLVPAYRPKK